MSQDKPYSRPHKPFMKDADRVPKSKFTSDGLPSYVDEDPIVKTLAKRIKKENSEKKVFTKGDFKAENSAEMPNKRRPKDENYEYTPVPRTFKMDKPEKERSTYKTERSFTDRKTGEGETREIPEKITPQRDMRLKGDAERISRVIARAGLCSRREAEYWIEQGRVVLNGEKLTTPAVNVKRGDRIIVDGRPLPERDITRLWLYNKPRGLVTTHFDPEGRPNVFDNLPEELPRVISIGRLDINTEGLLLLTNDGGLSRELSHPSTGWLRRYRVRAHGEISAEQLQVLHQGIEVDGVRYAPMEAELDKEQGSNVWLTLGLREGKNREVKNVLAALGLEVNRLIRISFGPFQLSEMNEGEAVEIRTGHLREQLGSELIERSGADFNLDDTSKPSPINATPFGSRGRVWRDDEAREASQIFPRRAYKGGDRKENFANDLVSEENVTTKDGREVEVSRAKSTRTLNVIDTSRPFVEEKRFRPKGDGDKMRPSYKPRRGEEDSRPSRPAFGDRPSRPSFGGDRPKPAYGDKPRDFKPREDGARSDGDRPKRDFGDRPARPAYGELRTFRPSDDGIDRPRPAFKKREDGDRPKRDFGDRPSRPAYGDRPREFKPREDGDRPKRDFGDRPARPTFGDRPSRPAYGDRPREFKPREDGDRPKRDFGDRPARPSFGGDRPRPAYGDKPRSFKPREDGDRPRSFKPREDGDRPKRDFSDRPARPSFGGDRPRPAYGDKPRSFKPREDGDRPRSFKPREDGDRPKRDFGDRPARPSFGGDRPRPAYGDKPRPAYGDKPRSFKPREDGDRPRPSYGDKPRTFKPRDGGGGGGGGSRPFKPRDR